MNSSDLTCNVNGLSGSSVETVTISPGTNITYGIFHHEMSFFVVKILSQASSGTSMTNAPAKMPYLLDTRGLYKCTLPKHPLQRHLLMDRAPSGLRSTLLVFSMPPLRSGPLMLLIPMVVRNILRSSSHLIRLFQANTLSKYPLLCLQDNIFSVLRS